MLIARIARYYGIVGKPTQALDYAQKAELLLGEMEDKKYQATATYYVGSAYLRANRKAKGLEHFKRALAICTELGAKEDFESLTEEITEIEKTA